MDNKNNTTVGEENLEGVTGGGFGGELAPGCYFQPNGNTRVYGNKLQAQCKAKCLGIDFCPCHKKDHCVDKWHTIDSETSELSPVSFSNHKQKKPGNRYNT